jgi:hypothetical protein
MLFAGTYSFRPGSDQRAGLKRFQAWAPPDGFVFQGHWQRADGAGGLFLAEVESAAAAFEATAAWADLIEFDIVPVLDVTEAVPVSAKVLAWIDSVS